MKALKGWVQFPNDFINTKIFTELDPILCKVYVTILLLAAHGNVMQRSKNGIELALSKGQCFISRERIIDICGKGLKAEKLSTVLEMLQEHNYIEFTEDNNNILIEINNWDEYCEIKDRIQGGWIKLYRCILSNPIFMTLTPVQVKILLFILIRASYEEKSWRYYGNLISIGKNQLITGLDSLVNKCGKGVTKQKVRTALKKFVDSGLIIDNSSNAGRLITVKYENIYLRTESEDNIGLTSKQQSPNIHATPIKNIKNNKNNKNNNRCYSPKKNSFNNFDQQYDKMSEEKLENLAKNSINDLI